MAGQLNISEVKYEAKPVDTVAGKQTADGSESEFSQVLSEAAQISSGSVDLDAIFEAAGEKYGVSPNFLKAVAKAESGFRPDATSKSGAMGIMQLMPATAKGLGVTDAYDPEQNIMGGAKLLSGLLNQFGDVSLAVAGYNAGGNAVTKYGGIPPYSETQNFVKTVMGYLGSDEIHAGTVAYQGGGAGGLFDIEVTPSGSDSGSVQRVSEAFAEMLLINIIEMQMKPSDKEEHKVV